MLIVYTLRSCDGIDNDLELSIWGVNIIAAKGREKGRNAVI